ncbi:hypothetical protein ACTXT7_015548 [Hymenolepis weldensis]
MVKNLQDKKRHPKKITQSTKISETEAKVSAKFNSINKGTGTSTSRNQTESRKLTINIV